MKKIQLINFKKDKVLFVGPNNKLTVNMIKFLIMLYNCTEEKGYGIRFTENNIGVLLLTPYEFLNSEV